MINFLESLTVLRVFAVILMFAATAKYFMRRDAHDPFSIPRVMAFLVMNAFAAFTLVFSGYLGGEAALPYLTLAVILSVLVHIILIAREWRIYRKEINQQRKRYESEI